MSQESKPYCSFCSAANTYTIATDALENTIQQDYDLQKVNDIFQASVALETRHTEELPRLKEIVLLAQQMHFKRIGLAFCSGLSSEACVIEKNLSAHFDVVSVCCKMCGIHNKEQPSPHPSQQADNDNLSDPVGQAEYLNSAKTDLNLICGLCVGQDALFTMFSKSPVITAVAKDRALAHNPVGAVYSSYIQNKYFSDKKEP